jgi:hypothetical protein
MMLTAGKHILYFDAIGMSIGFGFGSGRDPAQRKWSFFGLYVEASPVCDSMAEKLPTAVPEGSFSATLCRVQDIRVKGSA